MHNRQAFTLVELAVVMVIIGLLVGGILMGSSLLQAQKLRNVLADAKLYATAMQQFSDKYGALPGDFSEAERMWGNASGGDVNTNCANAYTSASPDGIKTCNGMGMGVITGSSSFWAWQQLSAAGFIPGNYTGVPGPASQTHAIPGVNVPKGALNNSGYHIDSWGLHTAGDTDSYPGDYDNTLCYGGTKSDNWPHAPLLTPGELSEMDKKADDGRPGTGVIRTKPNSSTWSTLNGDPICTSSYDPATATYRVASTNPGCIILFMNMFNRATKQ